MNILIERTGDNLYFENLNIKFRNYSLSLDVPEGIWNPTPHGIHLGNMLAKIDFSDKHVLELGTGCGIHAILIEKQGASKLTLTELDQSVLDNAKYNLKKHNCNAMVDYIIADWTNAPQESYDCLVTNPPFGKAGKYYRRYFIDKLILDAHKLVKPGGELIFVQSSMANIPRSIKLMEENGMRVEVVGETNGPFRKYYYEDPTFMKEILSFSGAYFIENGIHHERLVVFQATLPQRLPIDKQ